MLTYARWIRVRSPSETSVGGDRGERTHAQVFQGGVQLLVYEALSFRCMRPYATDVCCLTLLVYEAFSY